MDLMGMMGDEQHGIPGSWIYIVHRYLKGAFDRRPIFGFFAYLARLSVIVINLNKPRDILLHLPILDTDGLGGKVAPRSIKDFKLGYGSLCF